MPLHPSHYLNVYDLNDAALYYTEWHSGKESVCQMQETHETWVYPRSRGLGDGNPLQYSCLGDHMDRGAWRPTFYGVAESDVTEHARTRMHEG